MWHECLFNSRRGARKGWQVKGNEGFFWGAGGWRKQGQAAGTRTAPKKGLLCRRAAGIRQLCDASGAARASRLHVSCDMRTRVKVVPLEELPWENGQQPQASRVAFCPGRLPYESGSLIPVRARRHPPCDSVADTKTVEGA